MKIVVFHGTGGSPDINWFPWLVAKGKKLGHVVVVPRMPTPQGQDVRTWLKYVPDFDEDTILIGHSIGATFLLHVLENAAVAVKKSIFAAPVMGQLGYPEYDDLNFSFYDHHFEWPKIRANAGSAIILHGNDDPYVPLAHAHNLKDHIGGNLKIVPGGGHLNEEFGYTEFPEILAEIMDK